MTKRSPSRGQEWKRRDDSGYLVVVEEFSKTLGLVAFADEDGYGYGQPIEGFLRDFRPTGRRMKAYKKKTLPALPKEGSRWIVAKGSGRGRIVTITEAIQPFLGWTRTIHGVFADTGRRGSWKPEEFVNGKRFLPSPNPARTIEKAKGNKQ